MRGRRIDLHGVVRVKPTVMVAFAADIGSSGRSPPVGRNLDLALRYLRSHTIDGLYKARDLLDGCLERAPDDPECLAVRAYQHVLEWREGQADRSVLRQALTLARQAVRDGGDSYLTHWSKAVVRCNRRQFADGLAAYRDALDRAGRTADAERICADIRVERADALVYMGEARRAIDEVLEVQDRDSPAWYGWILGWACYNAGRADRTFYDRAVEALERVDSPPAAWLVRAAAQYRRGKGHESAARAAMGEFRQEAPAWTIRTEAGGPFRSDLDRDGADSDEFHWLEALKRAGLPDPDDFLPLPP